MKQMISALIKRPGEIPRHVNISNTLEALQKNVDGRIEIVGLAKDLVIICDEEGKLKGKPYNCNIAGYDLVGTILITGRDEEDLTDLPLPWADLKQFFPHLWFTNKNN